jgi:ATP-dependent Lon protease
VIIPRDNEKDLADVPANVQQQLNICFVDMMDEVLDLALERKLETEVKLETQPETPPALEHEASRDTLTN